MARVGGFGSWWLLKTWRRTVGREDQMIPIIKCHLLEFELRRYLGLRHFLHLCGLPDQGWVAVVQQLVGGLVRRILFVCFWLCKNILYIYFCCWCYTAFMVEIITKYIEIAYLYRAYLDFSLLCQASRFEAVWQFRS